MSDDRPNKGQNNFVTHAMILAAAALLSRLIGFVYFLPLTGMIGDDGNGIYSRAYEVYNFFLILSSHGMPAAISKLIAERTSFGRYDEAHRLFKVALAVAAVLGAVCMGVLFIGAGRITTLMQAPRSYYAMVALAPTVFIVAVIAVMRGYFQGLGTMIPTSVSQVVEQIFNAVFSVALAGAFMRLSAAAADPVAYGAAGGTAGTGAGAVFGLVTVAVFYFRNRKNIRQGINSSKRGRKEASTKLALLIIRTSLPIIAGAAVLSFSRLIDATMATPRLIAGGFTPERANELYGQLGGKYAHIITLPISIASMFAMASIPSISSSKAIRDDGAIESKINTALRMTMLICIPAAVGLCALGPQIILMLFRQHPEGGILLQVGAINIIFMALNQILTGPLQATGNLKIPVIAVVIGSVVKIIANMVLIPIPQINIVGAVIGTFLCYVVASSINWHFLKKKTGARIRFLKLMAKPVICSAVMGVLCFGVHRAAGLMGFGNTVSTVLALCAGVAAYLLFMVLSKGIARQDMLLLPLGKRIVPALERRGLL